jgi:plastocyanin
MALRISLPIVWLALTLCSGWAQAVTLKGQVTLERTAGAAAKDASGVVVWLTPISNPGAGAAAPMKSAALPHPRLVQTGKHFEPHLLIIPVGTAVEFPNKDPFFHNVFSLFEGKRFDLGLYEAGSSRMVRFDKPGISYIFCNIHPQMSAVVITLATPYYASSNAAGEIVVSGIPPGRYMLNIWFEGSVPEELARLRHEVSVSDTEHSLGIIRLAGQDRVQLRHKNKYGKDYDDQGPSTPGYTP